MTDEQFQQAADAWRALIAERSPANDVNTPLRSVAELTNSILAMSDRVRPWLQPPQRARSRETTAILSQWQSAWTRDLKNSPLWKTAKEQIAAIRELILTGQLDDADWKIRDVFIRCIPAVRMLAFNEHASRLPEPNQRGSSTELYGNNVEKQSGGTPAEELTSLLDWLERI